MGGGSVFDRRDGPDGATVQGCGSATEQSGPMLLRAIVTNAFALGVGALGALFTLMVARLLGEATLGGFALAWATADLLSKVGTLGLDQGTTAMVARRQAAGDGAGVRAVFRTAVATGLALSAFVAGMAWLGLGWLGSITRQAPEIVTAQRVMLLALPGVALYRIANGASRGMGIMKHDAVSGGLLKNLTSVIALVAFVWLGLPQVLGTMDTAVLAAVAGFTVAGAAAYVLARGALGEITSGSGGASARGLFPLSMAAAATGLANLAMMRMDVLVLGMFVDRAPGLSAAAFGIYCAAAEIAGITRKVRQAAEAPFLHAVATAEGSGRLGEERSAVGNVARWTLAASLVVAACLGLGAPLWLGLFGSGFQQAAGILVLLVTAHWVGSYFGPAEGLLLLRRPVLNLVNSTLGVVTYLLLCLALVPRMGATGAAVAAVATFCEVALLRLAELRMLGTHWPWRRLRGVLSAFLVALAPALVFRVVLPGWTSSAAAVVCFVVVFLAALVLWAVDDGDREAFRGIAPFLAGSTADSRVGEARRESRLAPPLADAGRPVSVILVVSSEDDGGAARSTFLLARDLPRFGVRPVVALHREGALSRRLATAGLAFEVVEGLPEDLTRRHGRAASLWAVPGNLRVLPRCVSRLRSLAERQEAAILYGQGTWANILSAFAARGSRVRAVWHVRNDHRPMLKRLLMRGIARALGVRAIVAVSRSAATPYEGLALPLYVVHNGADLAASDAARMAPDLRRRLALPEGAVLAGYAGRLLPHKGIHLLMHAARRAMRRSAGLHLVILGGNPAHTGQDVVGALARQAASWGLADRIHLAGWSPGVEHALAGLDFVVIPSTCRECGSRTLIESLCLGVPVIASRIGGNPEMLREGEDGLLVPPGEPERLSEALVTLATNSKLRHSMASRALAARYRFDSLRVARRAAAVLRRAASEVTPATRRLGASPRRAMRAAGGVALLLALCDVGCREAPRVWSIGIYRGSTPFDLAPAAPNPILTAADLGIADARFVADPFLLRHGERIFLFFEVWRRASGQGDIGWAENTAGEAWKVGGLALDEPFHLSYPFVFEHEGEVFLIPESRGRREVRLYVARPFPNRFELRRVLLSGKRYADTSLVRWGGRFYLFTSPDNASLELFSADALEGPYRPHPKSPVVSGDACAARPAGRPIAWGGRIIRLAQCDRPAYGASVRAFEITELSPTSYLERCMGPGSLLTGSGAGWNAGGMHHLDVLPDGQGVLAAVDGWRLDRGTRAPP